jgi:hypothetical protein
MRLFLSSVPVVLNEDWPDTPRLPEAPTAVVEFCEVAEASVELILPETPLPRVAELLLFWVACSVEIVLEVTPALTDVLEVLLFKVLLLTCESWLEVLELEALPLEEGYVVVSLLYSVLFCFVVLQPAASRHARIAILLVILITPFVVCVSNLPEISKQIAD